MPQYSFVCKECHHEWTESRRMAHSRDPATCPACEAHGDFRVIDAPQFILDKGDDPMYKIAKGLGAAKEERQEHQRKFGSYEKYAGTETVQKRREVSGMDADEDVTYMGNIGDRKEDYDAVADAGAEGE